MIAYRATLDVPRELAQFVSKLLADERRRRGTPRGSRALNCFWQAVLGLRCFRDRTSPEALARDHGISRATAYRYVDEVIAVLADEAPDLRQALERAMQEGYSHVILDGTIIPADRCREKTLRVRGEVIDLWYSGKAHAHGGNPGGARSGRVPAVGLGGRTRLGARHHRGSPPHPARPVPGGSGGAAHPGRPRLRRCRHRDPHSGQAAPCGQDLDINSRTRNALLCSLRCLGERGFALVTGRWRTLQHITASPGKIGATARGALVLTHFEYGYIK